jgi:hypothetical protein
MSGVALDHRWSDNKPPVVAAPPSKCRFLTRGPTSTARIWTLANWLKVHNLHTTSLRINSRNSFRLGQSFSIILAVTSPPCPRVGTTPSVGHFPRSPSFNHARLCSRSAAIRSNTLSEPNSNFVPVAAMFPKAIYPEPCVIACKNSAGYLPGIRRFTATFRLLMCRFSTPDVAVI